MNNFDSKQLQKYRGRFILRHMTENLDVHPSNIWL